MNIGIDVKCLSRKWTGISFYCADIIKNLTKIDKQNDYFLYSNKSFELGFNLPDNFHIKIVDSKIGTTFVRFKLKKYLIKDNIDVFWGPDHCLPIKSKKYKTILTVHDLAILRFKHISTKLNTIYIKLFLKKMCKEADRIIAVSNTTKDDIKLFYHIDNKVNVVYAGDSPYKYKTIDYSNEQVNDVMSKFKIDEKYIVFVSTIEPRKNIINIVKGFNKFKDSGAEFKLVLVGGIGWRTNEIMDEINKSQYVSDIILTGYVSSQEKEILYRNASFLIFPSLYEGFGLPVLEAMSIGLPVITSNNSGMKEVARDIGFLVNNPLDFNEIANQMKIVSNLNSEQLKDIHEKSIKRTNEFSREKSAKQILDLFSELILEE